MTTKQSVLNRLGKTLAQCAEIDNPTAHHVLLAFAVELDHASKSRTDNLEAYDAYVIERRRTVNVYRGLPHWQRAVDEVEHVAHVVRT